MLDESTIKQHKQLIEKVNELSQEKRDIITQGKLKRDQAILILKKYGYEDLKDVSKLQEKLDEMELEIKEERKNIEVEIIDINNLIEKVNSISVS
jgi:uncharacterized membrane protein